MLELFKQALQLSGVVRKLLDRLLLAPSERRGVQLRETRHARHRRIREQAVPMHGVHLRNCMYQLRGILEHRVTELEQALRARVALEQRHQIRRGGRRLEVSPELVSPELARGPLTGMGHELVLDSTPAGLRQKR